MENFHILKVHALPPTQNRRARVKITSERFQQSRTIGYAQDGPSDAPGMAIWWLQKNGFNIIGKGEGSRHTYLIVNDRENDQFRPLPFYAPR